MKALFQNICKHAKRKRVREIISRICDDLTTQPDSWEISKISIVKKRGDTTIRIWLYGFGMNPKIEVQSSFELFSYDITLAEKNHIAKVLEEVKAIRIEKLLQPLTQVSISTPFVQTGKDDEEKIDWYYDQSSIWSSHHTDKKDKKKKKK